MPLENLIRAGAKIYKHAKSVPSQSAPDPEIPVPGRKKLPPPPQPTNQSKANFIADVLKVPGRDVVRGAAAKRKKMLDDM